MNIALTLFRVERIPEEVLGRAVGMVSMLTDGAVAFGAMIAGYLLSVFDTSATGWMMVTAMCALAVAGSTTGTAPDRTTVKSP